MWQLGPGGLGDAAENVKPTLQALKSGLEALKLVITEAFSDTKDDLLPDVGAGEIKSSKEFGGHHALAFPFIQGENCARRIPHST